MKTVNWYTTILGAIGIFALVYFLTHLHTKLHSVYFIIIAVIIILEVFPIKLPSGDDFETGSIGFLFILIQFSIAHAVMGLTVGLLAVFFKTYRSIRIPLFRVIVNIGMYSISLLSAGVIWYWSQNLFIVLSVALTAITYEVCNLLLLEGIKKATASHVLFGKLKQQLMELLVPVSVYSIVIPTLLIQETDKQLIITMLYTLFFLLVIIFFSDGYTKQLSIRKLSSEAFIQILEERITSRLAGHGHRVGIICETLVEDFDYPKRNRHELIQAAIIHDIGKALLPAHIFRKRGDLTISEEREYRTHPEKAVKLVKTMFQKEAFSDWILYHHERWDGKGFPKGLKGEEIPFESRIIALANELDHILSRHNDQETILKLIKEKSGTILDPELVDKVKFYHIGIILEETQSYKEELPQKQGKVLDEFSYNTTYSNIGQSFFVRVNNGHVLSANEELPVSFLESLAKTAHDRQVPVHETYIHNRRTFDCYTFLNDNEVTIFAHDLTPYLEYRKELEQSILESYVEVVASISEERIKLHTSNSCLMKELGEWIAEIPINNNSDVSKSRQLTSQVLEQYPTVLETMKVQVSISEGVTNILKHATGGKLAIYQKGPLLQFFITDKGSGIPLHEIPKTILVSGYSSKRSLGRGFKLIANFSDSVQIFTSSNGTSMLIEYNRRLNRKKEPDEQQNEECY